MLVERGVRVMNMGVVGDAYAIASNYLRRSGALPDTFVTDERLLEIIVQMFHRDEVNKMRSEHDPIDHLRARMIENKVATDAELTATERKVRDIVVEAAQFAQDCPEPDPAELWTDVLAEAHP